jgi:hypothetical protein
MIIFSSRHQLHQQYIAAEQHEEEAEEGGRGTWKHAAFHVAILAAYARSLVIHSCFSFLAPRLVLHFCLYSTTKVMD